MCEGGERGRGQVDNAVNNKINCTVSESEFLYFLSFFQIKINKY